jgi:hypothetical protein
MRRHLHDAVSRPGTQQLAVGRPVYVRAVFEPAAVLAGLDDAQREAAMFAGGPLLVLAGAGAGKTRTLVSRAAWLLGGSAIDLGGLVMLGDHQRRRADECPTGVDGPSGHAGVLTLLSSRSRLAPLEAREIPASGPASAGLVARTIG